jgi:nucleoid-associated protein YgaU
VAPAAPAIEGISPEDARQTSSALLALVESRAVAADRIGIEVRRGSARLRCGTACADEVRAAKTVVAGVAGITSVSGCDDAPPCPAPDGSGAADDDGSGDIERAVALGSPRELTWSPPTDASRPGTGGGALGNRPRTYRVAAGDTLSLIAARTMGDGAQWQRIYELNRDLIGANPERLQLGVELRIPQD